MAGIAHGNRSWRSKESRARLLSWRRNGRAPVFEPVGRHCHINRLFVWSCGYWPISPQAISGRALRPRFPPGYALLLKFYASAGMSLSSPNVSFGSYAEVGRNGAGITTTMKSIMGLVPVSAGSIHLMPDLARFVKRRASMLSGGQQKMVALARALMSGTKILLLDEPFEGLSPGLGDKLGETIQQLQKDGLTVLLAESDLKRIGFA